MPSRQSHRHRTAALWRALVMALLLPVPTALAEAPPPEPATAGAADPQESPQEKPQAGPPEEPVTPEAVAPEPVAPEAAGPAPEDRETAPMQQSAPPAEIDTPPAERQARSGGPSRAPVLIRNAEPSRRRPPGSVPAEAPREGQAPQRGLGSVSPEEPRTLSEDDFGRWERNAQQCEIQIEEQRESPPERLPCSGVRLDQQLAGLLSIRFLPAAQEGSAPSHQLLFAGVLRPGSQPMRCRDSRCEPSWPVRVQLSALATTNVRTLGLPQARVVQGSCSLESTRVICTARDREGGRWQATVRW
jgi:hypothetical protein